MLEYLCSKVKMLSVKYLKAYKVRVSDYIRVEKKGSSSDCDDVIMFSADHHGNAYVNKTLTARSVDTKNLSRISEQYYAPASYTASPGTNPVVISLTTNDVLKNQHILINVDVNSAVVNLTLPTAAELLLTASSLLQKVPTISTPTQKGDWFIFTLTNNSPVSYCALAPVKLIVPATNGVSPNGTITITGSANGLNSICSGAAEFGLYFTNVTSGSVTVIILRLSGDVE